MLDARSYLRRAWLLLFLLVCLLAMALAWQWMPLQSYLDVERGSLHQSIEWMRRFPLLAIAVVALASTLAIPLAVIIVIGVLIFGPLLGSAYILLGAEIGAVTSFLLGRYLGHAALKLFASEKTNSISQRLGQRGFISIVLIRLIPAAPFAVVNMIAGASHVRLRDFLAGTLVGMLPGILVIGILADQIAEAINSPDWRTGVGVLVVVCLAVAGGIAFRKWLQKPQKITRDME
ncbi:TVP38/TMEM64 family protein [Dechloromonas sp. A34]|uniref:TVP38/TMEM64 family protein n=1 Tax=Dechloromonas sp. A34 TaxID=447588 RepID=UPI002248EB0C|nr:TVP38/TMEM64 family protein [Dechloromonas sp. A34]